LTGLTVSSPWLFEAGTAMSWLMVLYESDDILRTLSSDDQS
jgi:hypothetical protein